MSKRLRLKELISFISCKSGFKDMSLDKKFLKEWNEAVKKIQKAGDKTVRAAALQLFSVIIKRTPVGNPGLWKGDATAGYTGGSLRGNWQTTIGSPANTRLNSKDKLGSATLGKANRAVAGYDSGNSIFFTNNLPYAHSVEYGWSSQAPVGMVRVSVSSFTQYIDKAARENRI